MYLEGELERGIVPEESVWMHGGGQGEDGCLLLLRKMNLELLRRFATDAACVNTARRNIALHSIVVMGVYATC